MNLKKSADQSKAKAAAKGRPTTPLAQSKAFPVVGIGASAGGLEAVRQLLEPLPANTGMAFVVVSHLDPKHKSLLTELLARGTRIPVSEVSDGLRIDPDHVYVMPPNTRMAIAEGVLRLRPREEGRAGRYPVDHFLRTLAEDQSHRAIGVILSGTDSDGTLGLEEIKAGGGITFAQEPASAKYDGMPRSAIAAGHVDFVLPPEGIAAELARISRHPYVASPIAATRVEDEQQPIGRNGFRKILMLLRKAKGVDFSDYKSNTLHRRIMRRMILNKSESLEDYARRLPENGAEVEALYQDILINVTRFFRDPETFAVLKERIFPQIFGQRRADEPIRIWTLGCSTGEEAYSIAMSFVEFLGDKAEHIPVQIFATDLSDRGIEKARAGLYSKDIAENVSPERLRRFFTEVEGGYQVSKPVRDMVVFARQNVIADPPFSRLDLISCRNLLIYLEPVLQKQVLPTLHYALKPTGILWLGSSETAGAASDLFTPEDKKHRFYSKKAASSRMHFQSARSDSARDHVSSGQQGNTVSEQLRTEHDAQKEADRILLARYCPASVLITAELEILQFRGSTGAYLEPPPGKATLNLLKMAREGLMLPLRAAIQKAKKDDATVRKERVQINYDGDVQEVNLEVVPIKGLAANERSFLVLFQPAALEPGAPATQKAKNTITRRTEDRQVARLREELSTTREYMQSLVEQQEAANEELQSSSEEVQSSNEELQSINEELETAKEELESSNEELTTLIDELQNRNQELTILNDDQSNLFSSVSLPILMLDRDLRIRRFTPQAEKVLSLISTDLGRPIGDIRLKINCPDLEQLIKQVIDTIMVEEREVQDVDGSWYLMRVRPYKTQDHKIEGVVVVLVNIDALKRSEAEVREARDYAEAIVRTARDPLLILDADLRVNTANDAFYDTFNTTPAESERRLIYELGNRQWNIPRLRELLEEVLPRNSYFNGFEVTHDFETIGRRTMLLNARRLSDTNGRPARILLGIEDVTEQLYFQAEMRRSEHRYRRLFEAARDGVLLVNPETRQILDANPFMTELLGYTRAELRGKELFEIGLMKDEAASLAAFQELQEKSFIRYDDLPLETKTGERREVEFVSNLYREDERQIVQCNIRDITERKRAEEVLRESEERYRALFNLGPVAVYSCDTSGVIQEFNRRAAELWGRKPASGDTDERFCGSFKLFRPDGSFMPHEECPMTEVLSSKISEACDAEVCIERPDGSRIIVMVNIRPLKNKQGEITGAINCFYDITERKQVEEERARLLAREQQARQEAEDANHLKDEFLATLSHELRNPLNSIAGYSEVLVRSSEAKRSLLIRQAAETIHRNAKGQAQLINDLLDLSRLQTGKLTLQPRPVSLSPFIGEAVESIRGEAGEKEIKLSLDLTAELVVNADPVRVQQIVWNLVANAMKFTPKGGRVSVSLGREGDEAVLTVEDTGRGIDREFLPHVFEMFRQADTGTTRAHGGMGIGLALVHQLAELHGGRVEAHSEGAGRGARFTIRLPLHTASLILHSAVTTPVTEGELKGARILIVDDTQDTLDMLRLLLTSEGATVETALNGDEGLRAVESSEFDLIFSDISMPVMDGYEFLRALREKPRHRTTPAIALTGFGRAEDVERARLAGFTTHLTKPLEFENLVKLARVTLRK